MRTGISITVPRLRRWRRGARWARRKLASAPRAARIVGIVAIVLAVVALMNLVYHVVHKPTELFAFVGNRLDKEPAETLYVGQRTADRPLAKSRTVR
jgi:hypothetical protein